MRHHLMGTTVTLCAVALAASTGAAAAVPLPPKVPAAARQSGDTVLVDCSWRSQAQPSDFMIACGDGNNRLSSLHWSYWGSKSAVGTGLDVANDCDPYCAAGTFHSFPVVVRLEHPQPWKKHPRLRHYTQMTLIYTEGKPEGSARAVTYPLWD
ncbi:hypothetical protein AB0L85_23020 [Streptomyces sp. NPDC052051]|uniref:hypothetical protein n=1 Tax=Streptomyces sp. NPDC052051 TaxID=3154649 RepID=UPI00341D4989